ncbi:MAG: YbjN domain-containing protein [Oscillospiraceae bacterium]|nr:YbjN domain-containing protein [Oscillospiraceae bacterium]
MKMTRRVFAFALTMTLLLSLSAAAFADGARFDATKSFVKELETIDGFTFTVGDVIEDSDTKYELLKVNYAGGEYSDYESNIVMYFSENGEEVTLYTFNLIAFSAADFQKVLETVNDINAQGTGVKLYVDTSDNTVTAEMYQLATPETVTDLALTALGFMIGYTDRVFEETLRTYAAA